ncbi:MAG: hypothetical protein C0167_03250 [Nitrososphaera sp.]|nr:MAG: hypothetical protein C0167_03250 [Nitrososphaera sp.]
MSADAKFPENKRGVLGGWARVSHANFERWLYLLHRLTGIVVGLYLIAHLVETSDIVPAYVSGNKYIWENLMTSLYSVPAHVGLLIIAAFAVYHGLNGVRLFLAASGVGVGRPIRPEWPYAPVSLRSSQRDLGWLFIAVTLVLTIYAFYQLFIVAHPPL